MFKFYGNKSVSKALKKCKDHRIFHDFQKTKKSGTGMIKCKYFAVILLHNTKRKIGCVNRKYKLFL